MVMVMFFFGLIGLSVLVFGKNFNVRVCSCSFGWGVVFVGLVCVILMYWKFVMFGVSI